MVEIRIVCGLLLCPCYRRCVQRGGGERDLGELSSLKEKKVKLKEVDKYDTYKQNEINDTEMHIFKAIF